MNEHRSTIDRHDPFGWLKTLGLILVVFGLMIATGVMAAKAGEPCADQCRTGHNACRLQTKGAPKCDAQFNACVQQCIATLAKSKK